MTFKNNGKLEVAYYRYGENSECIINETASGIYDWKKVSEGLYNLSRGGNTRTTYEVSFPNMNTLHMTVQLSTANVQWQSYTYVYQKL